MSTSTVATVKGEVIEPSASANAKESAAHGIAQVLKELIHAVPAAFPTEKSQYDAALAVDKYVAANVARSSVPALADGNQRAPLEDVTQRVPPQGAAYVVPATAPAAIDYDKLAAAIVRQQAKLQSEAAAPAKSAEETEDDNAS